MIPQTESSETSRGVARGLVNTIHECSVVIHSVVFVCLSVCPVQALTFESLEL